MWTSLSSFVFVFLCEQGQDSTKENFTLMKSEKLYVNFKWTFIKISPSYFYFNQLSATRSSKFHFFHLSKLENSFIIIQTQPNFSFFLLFFFWICYRKMNMSGLTSIYHPQIFIFVLIYPTLHTKKKKLISWTIATQLWHSWFLACDSDICSPEAVGAPRGLRDGEGKCGLGPLGPEGNQAASGESVAIDGVQIWPRPSRGVGPGRHGYKKCWAHPEVAVCNMDPVTKISVISALFLSCYVVQSLPDS